MYNFIFKQTNKTSIKRSTKMQLNNHKLGWTLNQCVPRGQNCQLINENESNMRRGIEQF